MYQIVSNSFSKICSLCLLVLLTVLLSVFQGCSSTSSSGTSNTDSNTDSTDDGSGITPVDTVDGDGKILFSFGNEFLLLDGVDGATSVNMNDLFDSAGAGAGEEDKMGISRDGNFLVVSTTRLGCAGFACLARFNVDGTDGEKITEGADGEDLHVYATQPAISPDGSVVVFTQQNDDNSIDLFAITRGDTVWGSLTNITENSTYTYNQNATISADGSRVAFVCSNVITEDTDNNICEVNIDGTGFQEVIVAGDSNDFTNVFRPSYANNGDLYFEGILPSGADGTDGERVWRLAAARTADPEPAGDFLNAVSPCALPNGNYVVLWLGRPGGTGIHELALIGSDDALDSIIFDQDVDDVGISCSE